MSGVDGLDLLILFIIFTAGIGWGASRYARGTGPGHRHRWTIPPGDYVGAVPSYRRVCQVRGCTAEKTVGGVLEHVDRHPLAVEEGDAVLVRVFRGDPEAPTWERRYRAD
jgi:hypothetical protein